MAFRTAQETTPFRVTPPPPHGLTCPRCGALVDPDDRFCHACGNMSQSDMAAGTAAEVNASPAARPGPMPDAAQRADVAKKGFKCETCGAEITTDPSNRGYVCPFCDSTYVVEFSPADSGRQRPEFVIGFAVTPEEALERFRKWLANGSWFRPGDLHQAKIAEKLRGVYLPFWGFSMLAESTWSADIGEHWTRTETYTTHHNGKTQTHTRTVTETEWRPLAGRHHAYHYGYLVSGSRGLSTADARRIEPFRWPAMKRYEPYFLAGWLSEEYCVPREQALAECQAEFVRREQTQVSQLLPGDTSRNIEVQTTFSNVNSDLILLPIYLLRYRYGDKIYRFILNGQTGKVAGNKPVSMRRIGGLVALILAVLLILWLLTYVKRF